MYVCTYVCMCAQDGYYGPAATPHILHHMQLYTDVVAQTNHHVNVGQNVHSPIYAPSVVLPSLVLLQKAALATASAQGGNNTVGSQRIQRLILSPWYYLYRVQYPY